MKKDIRVPHSLLAFSPSTLIYLSCLPYLSFVSNYTLSLFSWEQSSSFVVVFW